MAAGRAASGTGAIGRGRCPLREAAGWGASLRCLRPGAQSSPPSAGAPQEAAAGGGERGLQWAAAWTGCLHGGPWGQQLREARVSVRGADLRGYHPQVAQPEARARERGAGSAAGRSVEGLPPRRAVGLAAAGGAGVCAERISEVGGGWRCLFGVGCRVQGQQRCKGTESAHNRRPAPASQSQGPPTPLPSTEAQLPSPEPASRLAPPAGALTPPARTPAATTALQCLLPADADLGYLCLGSLTPSALCCQTPSDPCHRHQRPSGQGPGSLVLMQASPPCSSLAHSLHREQLHLSELNP
ncbi:uncharacterized protein LOC118930369 [Manis pentadactyla]|uniref:uncharacterized protein LOC118930369 n=1 Tax=Manis pentadactyla TaxID=143292 RepID=UPI00255C5308|nr:uncharacterized protein LOC118930369 [Manis pentadactyla]